MCVCPSPILLQAGVAASKYCRVVLGARYSLFRSIHTLIHELLGPHRPGRIHHCMRSIGLAQAALDLMIQRVTDPKRRTFGKQLYEHGTVISNIARSRADIDGARLLVLSAAYQIDKVKAKGATKDIGIAKFTIPSVAFAVVDRAMQSFGAEGVSQDTPLSLWWSQLRSLRIADVSS